MAIHFEPSRGRMRLRATGQHFAPEPISQYDRAKQQMLRAAGAWLTRNSRCPCGSGRRFKRCCR